MKIGGIPISGPHEEILVLPRGDNQIVIKAQAVMDTDEFETLCPTPKPPGKLVKNVWVPDNKDETYRHILANHNALRIAFIVLKSLESSDIEWDTVDLDNPKTWLNYVNDFKNAGFSAFEINRIVNCVMQANSLDEEKLEQARKNFILGQGIQEQSSGQNIEQPNMQSGGLAKE